MASQVTRRTQAAFLALYGTSTAPAALWLFLMLGFGGAAAETYATIIEAPQRGELGALPLAVVNMLFAGFLLYNLLRFTSELKQIRLPAHRQLLMAALFFILGLTLVAPDALVLSLRGGMRDLLIVSAGSCTGIVGAVLWHYRRSVVSPETVHGAHDLATAASAPTPLRALRTMLGAPYAPASWRRRSMEIVLICLVLAGPPLLVTIIGDFTGSQSVRLALHASELLGLLAAMSLCWAYPISRVLSLFDPKRGALGGLAVLPGLGDGKQQRRHLYLIISSVPTAGLVGLLLVAMSVAWLQDFPNSVYLKLALQTALFPLWALPMLLSEVVQRRRNWKTWPTIFFSLSQTWSLPSIIWTWPWEASPLALSRWMRIGASLGAIALLCVTLYPLRRLALRPHPFVDVSS